MKTRINQSKTGAALLLTFYEGFSTYTITLPMPYGVRFFVEGLQTALHTLDQSEALPYESGSAPTVSVSAKTTRNHDRPTAPAHQRDASLFAHRLSPKHSS